MVNGVLLLVDACRGPHAPDPFCAVRRRWSWDIEGHCRQSTRWTVPMPVCDEVVDEMPGAAAGAGRHRGAAGQPHHLLLRPSRQQAIHRLAQAGRGSAPRCSSSILEHIPAPEGDAEGSHPAADLLHRLQRVCGPHRPWAVWSAAPSPTVRTGDPLRTTAPTASTARKRLAEPLSRFDGLKRVPARGRVRGRHCVPSRAIPDICHRRHPLRRRRWP